MRRDQAKQVAEKDGDGSDDQDEEDFERTQLRRMESFNFSRKQERHTEKSPYHPASLPTISTLTGLGTTSHLLIARLAELEEPKEKHKKIINDTSRALIQLDEEESTDEASVLERNKIEALLDLSEKGISWYNKAEPGREKRVVPVLGCTAAINRAKLSEAAKSD